jgi:hypothetical protein
MSKKRTWKRTPEKSWQERFLEELAVRGSVVAACDAAECSRRNAYDERDRNPEFARLWDEAKRIAVERMEDEARRRAVEGTLKPVFQGGAMVGKVREYSDVLLIFLLKAHDPKYREKQQVELVGKGGGPIQYANVTDAELDAEIERLRRV